MLDIYHFSNPFSPTCLKTEERLLYITPGLATRTRLRFIPLINPDTVTEYATHRAVLTGQPTSLADTIFHVVCDYKAAQIEGNKKARNFLVQIQQRVTNQNLPYSEALSVATAQQVGLNTDDFLHNRVTDDTLAAVIADQKLAQTMLQRQEAAIAIDDMLTHEMQLVTDFSVANLVQTFGPHLGNHMTPLALQQQLEALA
ncbi:DsbA family protein [Leuconostoc lactis]|uniref:DsbA family protein n=1 Tax=Leuconostoc lactis TaxID=1246 RepID=UPI0028D242D4|nr:DsbA family protein [Leuconostoc lactis]